MSEWFPWEQLPEESGKAWEAFQVYRDLGPSRTLEKAAKTLGKHSSTLSEMGRKWNWEPRVRAWDAEVDKVRRSQFLDTQMKMVEQHLKDATEMRKVAYEILRALTEQRSTRLVARDVVFFMQGAIKVEQAALGLPDRQPQSIDPREPVDVYMDNLSALDYLRELETAAKVIRSELEPSPKLLEANNTTEKADHGTATSKNKNRRRRPKPGK